MSSKSTNNDYVPILKTKKDVNQEALDQIQEERSGKQLGLYCRFSKLNIAVGKYWRFKKVILIAALSGHGKSALLNMILSDFLNKRLNGKFPEDVIIIHNTFEMMPVDEVLRTASSKVEKSTLHLLSSEYKTEEVHDEKGNLLGVRGLGYNTVSDAEVDAVKNALEEDEDLPHYYFETPTNVEGILANIKCGIQRYKEDKSRELQVDIEEIKTPKTVVAIDHTLLISAEAGDNVIDTMTKIANMSIYLKKKGAMVILIGQFNSEIEKAERIKNLDLHYPIKSDIYAQAQLYNACDLVLTIHQPELLGIQQYGKNKLSTHLLVHLQTLKQRFGKVGSIWLQNAFEKGKLLEVQPVSNK